MLKRLTHFRIFSYIGLWIVKFISATYRIRIINPEIEQNILKKGQVPIYASWHQRFFPGITFFATRKPISIMISRSRDGELISRTVSMLGWHPVRGSSSRGGRQALREIMALVDRGYKIAHIVDGPRGPFGIIQPGLLLLARASGMPILPTVTSAEKKWVFNSWDRFMVPRPFSRIIIRFGNEAYIHQKLKGSAFEKVRSSIENDFKKLYFETDGLWKNHSEIERLFGT